MYIGIDSNAGERCQNDGWLSVSSEKLVGRVRGASIFLRGFISPRMAGEKRIDSPGSNID